MNFQGSSVSEATTPESHERFKDAAPVVVFPPLLWLGAALVGTAIQWCWPIHLGDHWRVRSGGAGLVILGASFVVASNLTLRRAGTNVTPSKPTTVIVDQGVFRLSRNPMYLGGTLVYVGLALLLNVFWPLISLIPSVALLHWGVVIREEKYLERKFGSAYCAYKEQVRRWL